MNIKIWALVGIMSAMILGGYLYLSSQKTPEVMKKDQQIKTETMVKSNTEHGAKQVEYKDDPTTFAYAKTGKAVIFFKASWCPTCKAAQQDLDAHIGLLPKDLTIITADYDTTKELQKKYGVTYQHTWVQVDETGAMLTIWNGGGVDLINTSLK